MDRPSDELFPGAGLAKNKHCGVRRCDYLDVFERGFERWALPDDLLAVTDPVCGKRSEEHTSELQSQSNLVCRLLLEKKKFISSDDGEITAMQREPLPYSVSD